MSWIVAPAVVALQRTLNKARPGRLDNNPDGTIGDAAHAARESDHNPDADSMVCAVDVHDCLVLDDGFLYASIKAAGSLNPVKYAINNGRIWSPERGEHTYTGENSHANHCHVSVTQAGKRRTGDWFLPGITTTEKDDDMTPEQDARLKKIEKLLTALVAPRRPDHADTDPGAISLGDVVTAGEDK